MELLKPYEFKTSKLNLL
jgi:hypothetical protein